MSGHLLKSRKFAPLFWCQFFSAFNDTYLKSALTFLVIFRLAPETAKSLTLVGTVLLTAPAFLLSALGGEWADRYDKAKIARRLKFVEFGAVAIASVGFLMHSLPLLFVALGLFGILAALFGPVKYGILPDHLTKQELAGGNALVEGATFMAAILGPTVAAIASQHGNGDPRWAAGLTLAFAAIAWISARFIPPTGEAAPSLKVDPNILRSTYHLIAHLHQDKRLWRGGIITSLFWMQAIVIYTLLSPIVAMALGGDEMVFDVYNAAFAIGIATGSGLAAWLLGGRTLMLPTPIAAIGIGLVSIDIAFTLSGSTPHSQIMGIGPFFHTWHSWHIGIDLLLLAMAGGLYIVPSFAAVQAWAPMDQRARVVAAVNVLNAFFMVLGLLATLGLQSLGASFSTIFAILGIASLVAAAWIFYVLPTNPLRDLRGTRLPHRLSFGSHRSRKHRQGRPQRHHRPEPRQPARCRDRLFDPRQQPDLRDRPHVRAEMVDEAGRQIHERAAARSDAPARHPLAHSGGQGRRDLGDLPGGPHHPHRQPDEGLRRIRPHRGQGWRARRARPYRGCRAVALLLPQQRTGPSHLFQAHQSDDPGAAPRRAAGHIEGPRASPGGRAPRSTRSCRR